MKEYINKTLEEAQQLAVDKGLRSRIREVDGVGRMVTMDFRSDRVNLYVENGIVIDAKIG